MPTPSAALVPLVYLTGDKWCLQTQHVCRLIADAAPYVRISNQHRDNMQLLHIFTSEHVRSILQGLCFHTPITSPPAATHLIVFQNNHTNLLSLRIVSRTVALSTSAGLAPRPIISISCNVHMSVNPPPSPYHMWLVSKKAKKSQT